MSESSIGALLITLALLVLCSAFFSSSETGMMSLNRYRLKHLVNKKNKGAMRATDLLSRPDRLIGIILIGNNLVNFYAATIFAVIAVRWWGELGTIIGPILLTIVMLIFAEVTPKTVAALHPEKIAFPASLILKPLLILLYPFVWAINHISNFLAKLLGVDPESHGHQDNLNPDELRTVVDEAGELIPDQHQTMLLNILDLGKATVEDIMVPRNEVEGLDLETDIPTLLKKIRSSEYTRLPVYSGDINNVIGMLHLRNVSRILYGEDSEVTHEAIKRFTREPYFVPMSTPLHVQLVNFQKQKRRIATVVDEYGEVQGIVTLEDLLEEIVGDFTTNLAEEMNQDITPLDNGWYMIDASTGIREINRTLHWQLESQEAKTLNGLMMEHLESIPDGNTSFRIGNYQFETHDLSEKVIEKVKVKKIMPRDGS